MLKEAALTLAQSGIDSPSLDARLLLAHVLGVESGQLAFDTPELSEAQKEAFTTLVNRRTKREPLSHIIGKREFYGREFWVSGDVLDPRPDSETLIDVIRDSWIVNRDTNHQSPITILDLGAGSGCLLLTLLAEMENAYGVGVDISEKAIDMARRNARALSLERRVSFVRGRWAEALDARFDIIISNPPYIPSQEIERLMPEVRNFEPKIALDGGKDGLDCYREIAHQLPHMLAPNGLAALEIGIHQHEEVAGIIEAAGLSVHAIRPDLSGIPRCVLATR